MGRRRRSCHEIEDQEETQIEIEIEDEEEALSFCDLPVKENPIKTSPAAAAALQAEEDFDFNHWPPSPSSMCAADDVFFEGHLLPLRLSCSSSENTHFFSKNNLSVRSESMDHNNMMRFRNGSSSSSSSTGHYSRCSSISNNSNSIITTNNNSKARRGQKNVIFHSHPSPSPQIRSFSSNSGRRRSRSSSRWDFFRVGLLRTPRMELHDLKTRTTTNTNSFTTKTTASFLGVVSCKKSVDTVPPAAAAGKNRTNWNEGSNNSKRWGEKGKGYNGKMGKGMKEKEKEKEKENGGVSHRRTFEWLKQLSHATVAAAAAADEHY